VLKAPKRPNTPVVGENVYTQTSGIHADGDSKGNLYFNKLLPERFGGKRNYALGKTSGKASIQKNLEVLGIKLEEEDLRKVLQKVVQLGDKKEKIFLSDLTYIVSDVLGESVSDKVQLVKFDLSLKSDALPTATVKLRIDGKVYKQSSTGDGQYDAFVKAVRAIYKDLNVKTPKLIDYSVSIPPGGKTDALVETFITWKQKNQIFKTKGVDSDQTSAAIQATIKMLNQI